MNKIIIVVVVFLALAVLYEAVRQKSREQDEEKDSSDANENLLTADEAMPTQTGRFRAQEALAKADSERLKKAAVVSRAKTSLEPAEDDDPESPLPDPFQKEDS